MTKIVTISLISLLLAACSTTTTTINVYHPRQEPIIVIQQNEISAKNRNNPYLK